ncbi:MAG: hypothetical protein WA414_20155 [Acidobacteriaceae bacterium]|jgi:hypothetical protein
MVAQCAYVYENDHRCGRIPRRGETLCRDHRNRLPPRARIDEDAFERAMDDVADRFDLLPLPQLLDECATAIAALHPLVENKASAEERAAWGRASIAITGAIDRFPLETVPVDPSLSTAGLGNQPPPLPTREQLFVSAQQLVDRLQQKLAQQTAAVSLYNGNPQAPNGRLCI